MTSCIDDEMDRLLAVEIEKVKHEDMLWSEMLESDRQDLTEDRNEFLAAFYNSCDEEE